MEVDDGDDDAGQPVHQPVGEQQVEGGAAENQRRPLGPGEAAAGFVAHADAADRGGGEHLGGVGAGGRVIADEAAGGGDQQTAFGGGFRKQAALGVEDGLDGLAGQQFYAPEAGQIGTGRRLWLHWPGGWRAQY